VHPTKAEERRFALPIRVAFISPTCRPAVPKTISFRHAIELQQFASDEPNGSKRAETAPTSFLLGSHSVKVRCGALTEAITPTSHERRFVFATLRGLVVGRAVVAGYGSNDFAGSIP